MSDLNNALIYSQAGLITPDADTGVSIKGGDFTIEAWIKITQAEYESITVGTGLFNEWTADHKNFFVNILPTGNAWGEGKLFYLNGDGGVGQNSPPADPQVSDLSFPFGDSPVHVVVTRKYDSLNNKTIRNVYLNGNKAFTSVLDSDGEWSGDSTGLDADYDLYFGGHADFNWSFPEESRAWDLSVWSQAATDAEVEELYGESLLEVGLLYDIRLEDNFENSVSGGGIVTQVSLQGLAVNDPSLIGIVSDGSPLPNAGIISDPNFQDWTGTFVAGHDGAGKAVDLGVDGNHLQLTPIGGGNFTLAGYFYLDSVDFASMERDSAPLFVDWSVMGRNFFVYVPTGGDHAGKLSFTSGAGTDEQSADLRGPQFPMDQWVHVIAKRVGDTIQLYLDGVLVAEESGVLTGGDTSYISDDVVNGPHEPYWNYHGSHYHPGGIDSDPYWYNKFGIGGHSYDWGRFPGKIDKVLIYDRALSADEVVELHNNNGEIQGEDNMSYKFKISGPGGLTSDTWPTEQKLSVWSDDTKTTLLFEGALANEDGVQVPLEWTMTGINSITAGMYFQLEDQYDDGMLNPGGQAVQFAILDASDVEQFQATLAVGSDELDYLDLNDLGTDYLEMKVNASADDFEYVRVPAGGPVVVRTRIHHDQLRMPSHDEYEAELAGEFATPTLAVAGGAGLGSLQVQGLPLEYMGVDLDGGDYGLRGDGVGQMIVNKGKLDADITEMEGLISDEETRAMGVEAGIQAELDVINGSETVPGSFRKAIADVIDASPAALDTLNELAAALGDDADFAGTITSLISTNETTRDNEIADAKAIADAALAALQADVNTNESDADAAISAEETRALAAEAGIQAALDTQEAKEAAYEVSNDAALAAEVTRATAAEVALSEDLEAEEVRALAAEAGIQAALDTQEAKEAAYEVSNDAALAAEVSRATAAEIAIAEGLEAEEARAQAAESVLQGNIDVVVGDLASYESANDAAVLVERLRIDDILENVDPAALDSLTEIVIEMQSISGSLSDSIISVLGTHTSELSAHEAAYDAKMLLLDAEDVGIRVDFAAADAAERAFALAARTANESARDDSIAAAKATHDQEIVDAKAIADAAMEAEQVARAAGDAAERAFALAARTANESARDDSIAAAKATHDAEVAAAKVLADAEITNIKADLVSLDNQFQQGNYSPMEADLLSGMTIDFVNPDGWNMAPMSALVYISVNGIMLRAGANADFVYTVDGDDNIAGVDISVPLYEGDRVSFLGVKAFILASS